MRPIITPSQEKAGGHYRK